VSSPALQALVRPAAGSVRRMVAGPAAALAAVAVLVQISYPLLSGDALRFVTVAGVLLFTAASVTDAAARWGARAAVGLVVVAGGGGLLAETAGVHTGFPFGEYVYAGTLGPQLLGVPVLVPMAWTMMAYPCLLLGRRLAAVAGDRGVARRVRVALAGGLALASWDLFLDPQMVQAGHWTWAHPTPALPGVPGIPLTNYAGWVLVAVLMVGLLDRVLPDPAPASAGAGEGVPAGLLAWTWLGSTVGNLVFFDRPWVAVYGGVVMGLFVGPYLLATLRRTGAASAREPARAGR